MHSRTEMPGISAFWRNCFRKTPGGHFGISVSRIYEFS
ncbi:Uncharacterized protein dnm_082470 [Desulfonema magnum]|uniref:Uncharacterized protein n=1 Tax=Desulfonema magnum TaxID=45655 RepID=A0A975BQD1_9BACT|nr:Uncharacterized protein dnm_039700 [Desulfonema magnum]QTA89448.1 Uncharacterized protein dnm_055020 [Desulfonema magnum]QTA92171.1 Uncharacterized protein dnm_082470 [Desulfonema magnum]